MIGLIFGSALAMSAMLCRFVPAIRREQVLVERGRNGAIDGLRGCLGIGVLAHHTAITWYFLQGQPWQLPPSRVLLHAGQSSVALFFMITAFLFWGRVLERREKMDWAAFLMARLYRLYPAYLVMVALLLAAVFTQHVPQGVADIVRNSWAIRQWLMFTLFTTPNIAGVDTRIMVAGVVWSLRYEWLFYLALPLLALLLSRSRNRWAAALSALALLIVALVLRGDAGIDIMLMAPFLGGMAAAHLVRVPQLSAWLGRGVVPGVAALAALTGVIALTPTAYEWPAILGLSVFFAVIACGHRLGGLLTRPALIWLGDITYSIYLLHGLTLWFVFQRLLPRDWAGQSVVFLPVALVVAALVVLIASLVFLLIERPAILAGRRHYAALKRAWGGVR